MKNKYLSQVIFITSLSVLSACGGGGGSSGSPGNSDTNSNNNNTNNNGTDVVQYTLGGTLAGLASGQSVVLGNNGGEITLNTDGVYVFPVSLANSAAYNVTVMTQPAGQICSVSNDIGAINGANITNVDITCVNVMYTVGGAINGLAQGASVVLQNNAGDDLILDANNNFSFPTTLPYGGNYAVTVLAQPSGQTCSVTNGTGTTNGSNITDIVVNCISEYAIGGSISGLRSGTSVILQNNAGDDLVLDTNGNFNFTAAVAQGSNYAVTVLTQPSGQTCSVSSGSGTMSAANVTSVSVTCSPWTRQMGSTYNDYINSVASDTNGNIFIAGYADLGDFDGAGPDVPAGNTDPVLAKYSANGNLLWAHQIGSSSHDFGYDVAADASGNAYVVGSTYGDLDGAGAQVFAGGCCDAFVVKYKANGDVAWIRQFGSNQGEEARSVAIDASGNVYITGYTRGDMDGAGSQTLAGGADVFLIKYNTDGALQWIRQFGSTTDDGVLGLVVNGSNVYMTGYSYGSFDGIHSGVYVAAYSDSGNPIWISQFGVNYLDAGYKLGVDSSGNIYVAGNTWGDMDGTGSGTYAGGSDMFVAKLNSSGTVTRITQSGTTVNEFATGIQVDGNGNAYVTGYVEVDANDFGDLRTFRIDANGTIAWTRSLGTSLTDGAFGLGIALHGTDVYVAGTTEGGIDGNSNLGGFDGFIVKYNTSGTKQ